MKLGRLSYGTAVWNTLTKIMVFDCDRLHRDLMLSIIIQHHTLSIDTTIASLTSAVPVPGRVRFQIRMEHPR